jgi:hypothetical protein
MGYLDFYDHQPGDGEIEEQAAAAYEHYSQMERESRQHSITCILCPRTATGTETQLLSMGWMLEGGPCCEPCIVDSIKIRLQNRHENDMRLDAIGIPK